MPNKEKLGPYFFWTVAFLVIPLWLLSYKTTTFQHNKHYFLIQGSEICALTGFALYSLTFILSARFKWLEQYFDGLDKMYQTHHKMAKLAFYLLLLHPILLMLRWIPENILKASWYLLPLHRRLAVNLGSLTLWGLIVLMLLTLVIRLPYDKWKISHKLMGIFYILGALHAFFVRANIIDNLYLFFYFAILTCLAVIAYFYKTIFFDFVIKHYYYTIEKIEKLNEKVMEITLLPKDEPLKFIPGEYCFFKFFASDLTQEAHPFTMCSTDLNGRIQIIVKALGDFTKNLYLNLKPNAMVSLEGPYGRFYYKTSLKDQIWIGGGVGVAPFISWLRSIKYGTALKSNIDFYYCVNKKNEIAHYEEFKIFESQNEKFHIHLVIVELDGFLKASDIPNIQDKEIYICGPKGMRAALLKEFKNLKIPNKYIHYEDFDFL